MPADEINKFIWLFNDHWPALPEGLERKGISYEKQQEIIDNERIEALKKIYAGFGVEKVRELAVNVKESAIFGDTLAVFLRDDKEILYLCELLHSEEKPLYFIQAFLFKKAFLNGLSWLFDLYERLKSQGYSDKALCNIFIPLIPSLELWDFIESKTNESIKEIYWLSMFPRFWNLPIEAKLVGINKLVEYKRYLSAIQVCYYKKEDVPSDVIIKVLEKAVTEKSNDNRKLDSHEIEGLFSELEKRTDIHRDDLFKLEWYYLPILASYGSSRRPKLLHQELTANPQIFVDVLKLIYKPDKEDVVEPENIDLPAEQKQQRARLAYDLLESWKSVPGHNTEGKLEQNKLSNWIDLARNLATKAHRLSPADIHIGKILAQYPETETEKWPPDEISAIIERIHSDSLRESFSAATANKRSFSSRAALAGGDIERGHARYFSSMATKKQKKYPITAAILKKLSLRYLEDAKRMDESAERDRLEY
jgi:hypothetical protein